MKYLLLILILSGCYTKKRAIEKFYNQDTVTTTIHDTIYTETVQTDSVFSVKLDSIFIRKDKLSIKYIRVHDSIYLSGECQGDTVYYTKEIKVPITQEKPIKWYWLALVFMLGALFAAFISRK